MGDGSWSTNVFEAKERARQRNGTGTFHHTDQVRTGARRASVHELVDPNRVNQNGQHADRNIREALLSDEHPDPTPIAVVLDVTGSNYRAAETAHTKLPQLHGLLQRKSYVEDPQILFGATGDAHSDVVPLQMGQFESDNRMDDQLAALYLEGGGGGQSSETYELAAYFLTHHTYLEPWERFGKKGFAFFIGDEMPYDAIKPHYGSMRSHTLESLVGDAAEADIPTRNVFAALEEKFHVFFLFQEQGSYRAEEILPAWRELLGERALQLEDPAAVCEVIGATLGMFAGGIDLEDALSDLRQTGSDNTAVEVAGRTLERIQNTTAPVADSNDRLGGLDAGSPVDRI